MYKKSNKNKKIKSHSDGNPPIKDHIGGNRRLYCPNVSDCVYDEITFPKGNSCPNEWNMSIDEFEMFANMCFRYAKCLTILAKRCRLKNKCPHLGRDLYIISNKMRELGDKISAEWDDHLKIEQENKNNKHTKINYYPRFNVFD